MKYFLSCLIFCAGFTCQGQVKQLSALPAYDCSLKKLMAIIGRPTIILSPADDKLQSIINEYCGDLGDNCTRKTLPEMRDTDYSKPLFIVGEIGRINNWSKFKVPVKKISHGFEINHKKFIGPRDGFAFIDSGHVIVSGNSLQAIKDVQLAFTGGYDITVLEKNKITFFGNFQREKFEWYNLQHLKTSNYNKRTVAGFSAVYLSKTFTGNIDFVKTNAALKKYAAQFLAVYHIPKPAKKVDWFIHSNIREYGMMSGMFGLTCPGNNSGGFSVRGEIHTNGLNLPLVEHEYSHYLFDNAIPQDHNPAFFVEGSVEYVTGLNDTTLYRERLAIAKGFADSLDFRFNHQQQRFLRTIFR